MVKHRKHHKGKKHHKREYRPMYHAKRKKKAKMPLHVKQYFKCRNSGKSKAFCKKKYIKPHGGWS